MNDQGGRAAQSAEQRVAHFAEKVGSVRAEVGKLIVGQKSMVDGVLTCLLWCARSRRRSTCASRASSSRRT
jgi:hypothetical protein